MGRHYKNEIFNRAKITKYVKEYGFLSFAFCLFGERYDKKLMDTATKAEIDAAKTDSKWEVQKTA